MGIGEYGHVIVFLIIIKEHINNECYSFSFQFIT